MHERRQSKYTRRDEVGEYKEELKKLAPQISDEESPFFTELQTGRPGSLHLDVQLDMQLFTIGNAFSILDGAVSAVPQAHDIKNTIIALTKLGIEFLKRGDEETVLQIEERILKLLEEFKQIPHLRGRLKEDLQSQAEQEIAEYMLVRRIYPSLVWGRTLRPLPGHEELGITLQAYLAGIGDVPGEVANLMEYFITWRKPEVCVRLRLRKRYLDEIAYPIYQALDHFEGVPDHVINNSSRFRSSFKYDVIRRARGVIRWQEGLITQDETLFQFIEATRKAAGNGEKAGEPKETVKEKVRPKKRRKKTAP